MKIKLTTNKITNEQFISRAFYLLYLACGREVGMGVFQARAGATEKDIYDNVVSRRDYCFSSGDVERNKEKTFTNGNFYGDYVFGRMMKWGCQLDNDVITLRNGPYYPDSQGFAYKYDSPAAITQAVMDSFGVHGGVDVVG